MLALSPDQFKESSEFIHRPYGTSFGRLNVKSTRLDYTTTNAGLLINLPIAEIDEKQQLYVAFLACTESQSLVRSAILLHTTVDTPEGYFWRASTDAGPIERNGELWFQAAGRELPKMTSIYILPKLNSVSQDHIEPPWDPLEFQGPEDAVSRLPAADDRMDFIFRMRRSLVQAKDPCREELQSLQQARQTIYGQAALSYKEQLEGSRVFPKQLPSHTGRRFFGRSAELRRIRELYKITHNDTNVPNAVAISGIGKIGKTELAREFAYRCRDENLFPWIIWIDASTPATIDHGFHQVAKDIGLDHTERDRIDHVISSILQWLEGLDKTLANPGSGLYIGQWLLVLDNIQNSGMGHLYWDNIALAHTGRVLFTSRNHRIDNWTITLILETIVLGPLDDGEANHMLQSLTHTNEDLSQVVAGWDGTPLTLAQISSMATIQQLLIDSAAHIASGLSHRRNGLAISKSLDSQFAQLEPSAFAFLSAISFFDAGSTIHDGILDWTSDKEGRVSNMDSLIGMSLLTSPGRGKDVRILRLVQYEVQARLKPVEYNKALAEAISLIFSAWEWKESGTNGQKWICDNLLAHLLQIEPLAEKFLDSEVDTTTKTKLVQLMHKRKKLVS